MKNLVVGLLSIVSSVAFASSYVPGSGVEDSTGIETVTPALSADLTPAVSKSSLYFEGLGRGLLYGVGFEKPLTRQFALGLEASYYTMTIFGDEIHFTFVSPYAAAYTNGTNHRAFVTGALEFAFAQSTYQSSDYDWLGHQTNSSSQTASTHAVIPSAGVGYEFRADSGFIFRTTLYALYFGGDSSSAIQPWLGITLGSTL